MYTIQLLFLFWACVWIASAIRNKAALSKEVVFSRLRYQAVMLGGFILMFTWLPPLNKADSDWFARTEIFDWTCIAFVATGLSYAIYARKYLGRNWSGTVQLKKDHILIRSGPYRLIRHPIYSGLILAFIGLGIFLDRWIELPAILLLMCSFWMKARREEAVMLAQFGEAYQRFQQEAGMFLPRLTRCFRLKSSNPF